MPESRVLRPMSEKPTLDAVYPLQQRGALEMIPCYSLWKNSDWHAWSPDPKAAAASEYRIKAEWATGWYDEPQHIEGAPKREIRVGDRVRLKAFADDEDGPGFYTHMQYMVGQVVHVKCLHKLKPWASVPGGARAHEWAWPISACELVADEAPQQAKAHDPIDYIDPNAEMIRKDGPAKPKPDYAAIEREHLGDPDKRTGIYAPKAHKPNPGLLLSWGDSAKRWTK